MKIAIRHVGLVRAMAAGFCTVVVASVALAADTVATEDCRSIEDDALRLACYDGVTSPAAKPPAQPSSAAVPAKPLEVAPAAAPPVPATPAPAAAVPAAVAAPAAKELPAAETVPLDDEVGREKLSRDDEAADPGVRGRVVSCREDATGKHLFYFDNGQIWKQKDNSRIRWQECEFDVTISKDFFGYKMVRDGEKSKVRIARIK